MRQLVMIAGLSVVALFAWPATVQLAGWWTRPQVDPAVGLVTIAALVGWIILARTLLGAVVVMLAALPSCAGLLPLGRRLVPALLRPVVLGGVGAGLVASSLIAAPASAAPSPGWSASGPGWSSSGPAEAPAPDSPDDAESPDDPESPDAAQSPGEAPSPDQTQPPDDRDDTPHEPDGDDRGAASEEHRVGPGDSLWTIVEGRLGSDATAQAIADGVRAVYSDNRDAIGKDPNTIPIGLTIEVRLP